MCQSTPTKEVTVSTYRSLYKNSPQTLENVTTITSTTYTFPDRDSNTYPSITFSFSVGDDVVWVYGVDETVIRDVDLAAANFSLSNCAGSSGGPVIEDNITTISTSTYTILTSDYVLWVTTNSTLTLPTIAAASIGRVYRIFARGVMVRVNTSGGDTINNNSFVRFRRYQMITLRAGVAGEWGIGD